MELSFTWVNSCQEIGREKWDGLAALYSSPLLRYSWFAALEGSGSISSANGWSPLHLCAYDGQRLVALAPLYLKKHSEGEFVWDFSIAEAANHMGLPYYPKLVGMVPATPCRVYRFLLDQAYDETAVTALIIRQIEDYCRDNSLSSFHLHYLDDDFFHLVKPFFRVYWRHQSFEWDLSTLVTYDDYLAAFSKNQRRNIKKEQLSAQKQGLSFQTLTDRSITTQHLDQVYDLYALKNAEFGIWAAKYLNRQFFRLLITDFRPHLLLILAKDDQNNLAGLSFLVHSPTHLFGRYWGSYGFFPHLHFNLCYYQPLRWALEHKISRFDPGIGGDHKVRRGFLPVPNFSVHKYFNRVFNSIMEDSIDSINAWEELQMSNTRALSPLQQVKKN